MSTSIEDKLTEAISEGFDDLKELRLGSEEYASAVKSLAQLEEINHEEDKMACEQYEREDRLAIDKEKLELDKKQAKENSKWYKKAEPYAVAGLKILGSTALVVTIMRFESKGYIWKLGDASKVLPKI